MKKITFVSTAAVLVLAMVAVGAGSWGIGVKDEIKEVPIISETPKGTEEDKTVVKPLGNRPAAGWTFGFSSVGNDSDYYNEVEKILKGYIEQSEDNVITLNPEGDSKLQAEQLEEMIRLGVDAVFLVPIDAEELQPVLSKLKKKGIPVINMKQDWGDLESEIATVDADSFNAGYLLGEYMVNHGIPGKDAYNKTKAIIISEKNRTYGRASTYGFRAAIGDSFFRVEKEIICSHDKEELRKEIKAAVDEIEDLVYILSICDEMTVSILEICQEEGYEELRVFAIGGSPKVKTQLQKGNKNLEAIVAKSPISLAMNAYAVMMQYLDGQEIKEEYLIAVFLMTKDNIENYSANIWQ